MAPPPPPPLVARTAHPRPPPPRQNGPPPAPAASARTAHPRSRRVARTADSPSPPLVAGIVRSSPVCAARRLRHRVAVARMRPYCPTPTRPLIPPEGFGTPSLLRCALLGIQLGPRSVRERASGQPAARRHRTRGTASGSRSRRNLRAARSVGWRSAAPSEVFGAPPALAEGWREEPDAFVAADRRGPDTRLHGELADQKPYGPPGRQQRIEAW